MGKKWGKLPERVTVRLSETEAARLHAQAASCRKSVAEIGRAAIRHWLTFNDNGQEGDGNTWFTDGHGLYVQPSAGINLHGMTPAPEFHP